MEIISNMLGFIADVIGVVTFLFTIGFFWYKARKYSKALKLLKKQETPRPIALAISLAGTDIKGTVEKYLQDNSLNMKLVSFYKPEKITHDNFLNILAEIKRIKLDMTKAGVTEVHLFLSSTLTLASAIGAIFDNWVPIKLYHYTGGGYELHCVLEKETIVGLEHTSLLEKVYEV